MSELVPCVPGLLAIYEDGTVINDGIRKVRKRETSPIVGYFKDAKGNLTAAIIGSGAFVVPATSIKGFCGVVWAQRIERVEMTSGSGDGNSVFEKIFGRF